MFKTLSKLANSHIYWVILIVFGIFLESAALVYQYILDYRPCVICIHVRLWIVCFIVISIFAILFRQYWKASLLSHLLNTGIMAALLERSYQLLGTERGWTFGSCGFDLGLPDWFAIEEWMPSVFKVWEPCGYTPEIIFGVTMAESLVAISLLLLLISGALLIASILNRNNRS